jgi:hypothetical protein
MKCEGFKAWLEEEGRTFTERLPEEFAAHCRTCPDCQSLLQEEGFWTRFFAATPEASLSGSLWPGVMARIQEQTDRSESFSTALLWMGRRLAPAFALVLLLLGGAAFWPGNGSALQDSDFAIEGLVEPDTVLNQWVGVSEE